MLYNNQDPYTVGLVVLNQRVLKQELQQAGVDLSNGKAFEKAIEMVDEEIKKYHAGGPFEGMFPTRWLPTATGIVAEPFSEENGLINSTLKMVRTKVADRHRDLLDYLYTPAGKQLSNERNKAAIIELLSS
jgi:long-chain acyl-CoA synthetase